MAEDSDSRTEAATPARLSRAKSEGHAPVSHELASFANLGAALLVMLAAAPGLGHGMAAQLSLLLANAGRVDGAAGIAGALRQAAGIGSAAFLPLALAVAAVGAGVVLAQTQFGLRLNRLAPDFSRISPMTGIGRLFGANHGVDAIKSILKIIVLTIALGFTLRAEIGVMAASTWQNPALASGGIMSGIIAICAPLIVVQALIAVLDVGWSRANFARTMRMSREEIKQETKDSDGDPHIKAKRRAIRNARARQNMKKIMAGATVVVTNPTHYSVALAYTRNSPAPPKIIAKGVGEMAARIREMAKENGTPIVPNPPLARALHELELDSEIPLEHYKAVADIIAYIWRLEAQAARAKMI